MLDTRPLVVSCQKKRQQGFTKQWTWELTFMTLLNALFWRAEREQKKTVENHCKECNERKMEQNAMSIFSYEFLPQVCCSTEYTQEGRLKEKLIKIFTCDANRKFDIWTGSSSGTVLVGSKQLVYKQSYRAITNPKLPHKKASQGKTCMCTNKWYVHSLLFCRVLTIFQGLGDTGKTLRSGEREKSKSFAACFQLRVPWN